MTDQIDLDKEFKMAEIEHLKAETARLQAETAKINAESLKLQKDAKWHPWLAIILASVAIVVALVK